MKLVWKFGDGSVAFTHVADTATPEYVAGVRTNIEGKLAISVVGLDKRARSPKAQAALVASLGAGAYATYAGTVSDAEYNDKFENLRTYREAYTWTTKAPTIDIDMEKCKEIHRHDLRRARAPLLADLDVDYQRADERGDAAEKQRIAAKKQALRDVTDDPAIEAAKTPEELMAAVPEVLKDQQ